MAHATRPIPATISEQLSHYNHIPVVLLLTIFLTLFSPSMSPNYIKTIDPEDEPIQQDTRNVQTRTGIRTYERTVRSKPYQRPNNPPVRQTPTAGPSKTRTTTQGVQNQPRMARATPSHPPNYQQDDDMMVVDEEPSELPPHPQLVCNIHISSYSTHWP